MDLILWRHAEAHDLADGQDDLKRELTSRGEKQATRMANWLDRQLPDGARILVSPSRRTEQTAQALHRKFKLRPELAPDATVEQLLQLVQWPLAKNPVVVVGHQPTLGQTIAHLLGLPLNEVSVKRGAIWWLRYREREAGAQTVVVTVQSPEVM